MSHRRPSRPAPSPSSRRRPTPKPTAAGGLAAAARFGVEPLEVRRLLTTFSGSGQFAFADGAGNASYLIYNDVTFEAIGAHRGTTATSPNAVLSDLQPYPLPTNVTPAPTGTDIFKIYVTQSAADSYIAISHFTASNGHLDAFGGGPSGIGVANTAGGYSSNLNGTGGILIGGVYFGPSATPPGRTDLTTTMALNAPFGLQPAPADGELEAGIEVVPTHVDPVTGATVQNDFGNFLVGGIVTGAVSFGGNVNLFYAGGIDTGLSTGGVMTGTWTDTGDSARADPGNFSVAGDLRELLSGGNIGTDGTTLSALNGNTANDPAFLDYVSDFDLTVGGSLGEVRAGIAPQGGGQEAAQFAGTIEVANSPLVSGQVAGGTVVGNTANQTEFENRLAANPDDVFEEGLIDATNDTPATAQFLASTPELTTAGTLARDANGNLIYHASVDGFFDPSSDGDTADYYAMPMMAGTTFTVDLVDTSTGAPSPADTVTDEETLSVYDPDGRLVASNLQARGSAIQVTADRPGVYYFEVTDSASAPGATGGLIVAFDYNLTVTNTGNLAIGAISVNGQYADLGYDGAIVATTGDIGAIDVTGAYLSTTDGPTPSSTNASAPLYAASSIVVDNGDLRALIGGTIGETAYYALPYEGVPRTTSSAEYLDGPFFNISAGGIGLIQSTGLMDLNSQFDPNYLLADPTHFVTDTGFAHAIHGGIQVIDAGGSLEALLATDAGIGTIRAGDMATARASYIDVNADNAGSDGIIDLIDCVGALGESGVGGPELVTNTNGHVRYMQVGGLIYLPLSYNSTGVQDSANTLPVGQAATMTDDAGDKITITPEGVTTTTTTTVTATTGTTATGGGGTTTTTTTGTGTTTTRTLTPSPGTQETIVTDAAGDVTTTTVTGPQISMLTYPVADKGGQIPISITSTGSVVISAVGPNGGAADVDLSSVTIAGQGRAVTATGTDQFGNAKLTQPAPTSTANGSTGTTANSSTGAATPTATSPLATITGGAPLSTAQLLAAAATDATDLFVLFRGSSPINVLNLASAGSVTGFVGTFGSSTTFIAGADQTTAGAGAPVAIVNQTGGEMVNVATNGVGTLQTAGNLGFATGVATAAAVYPRAVVANTYPFAGQHTAVQLSGDAVNIYVGGAVGSIISAGTIGQLTADYGNNPPAGVFAGIVGPVQAAGLLNVQVGQGLAASGTGNFSRAGLYSTGPIGVVTNGRTANGDIRGDIISLQQATTETAPAIGQISLGSGSIIGSHIYNVDSALYTSTAAAFQSVSVFSTGATYTVPGTPVNGGANTGYNIGSIVVNGNGGIIGADILASSVGPITVGKSGFGVLNTTITGVPGERIGGITAGGYGIRNVTIDNGGSVGALAATGSGANLPVTAFPIDVRPTDVTGQAFDPFTGNPLSALIDLNLALGGTPSASAPVVNNVTDTGVIQDLKVSASQDITGISAVKVRTALPLYLPSAAPIPSTANIPIVGTTYADSLTTSGPIGYIRVGQVIDGLQVTAGSIGQFTQTGGVNRLGIDVAGAITSLTIRGNLGSIITNPATLGPERDSYVIANGISGSIGKLTVYGNLYADVFASKYLGTVNVQGNLSGNLTVQGVASNNLSVTSLTVTGSIDQGALNITGSVGTLKTGGSLGTAGGSLTIGGGVKSLTIGGNRGSSSLALALTVAGSVGSMTVNGSITGPVHVTGDLNKLTVNGGGTNTNAIAGAIQVDGRLQSATIGNGNVAANVTATFDVGTFTVRKGSVLAGATLTSTLGSIKTVRVTGGNFAGSIADASGAGLNLYVDGSLGNGTTPSSIVALSANSISIGHDVLADTTLAITTSLANLTIGGDIQAGATVSGHPITHHRVKGATNGTLVTA